MCRTIVKKVFENIVQFYTENEIPVRFVLQIERKK